MTLLPPPGSLPDGAARWSNGGSAMARLAPGEGGFTFERLTVAEIAWRVGYNDTSRFTALFKRALSVTPGAYRGAKA